MLSMMPGNGINPKTVSTLISKSPKIRLLPDGFLHPNRRLMIFRHSSKLNTIFVIDILYNEHRFFPFRSLLADLVNMEYGNYLSDFYFPNTNSNQFMFICCVGSLNFLVLAELDFDEECVQILEAHKFYLNTYAPRFLSSWTILFNSSAQTDNLLVVSCMSELKIFNFDLIQNNTGNQSIKFYSNKKRDAVASIDQSQIPGTLPKSHRMVYDGKNIYFFAYTRDIYNTTFRILHYYDMEETVLRANQTYVGGGLKFKHDKIAGFDHFWRGKKCYCALGYEKSSIVDIFMFDLTQMKWSQILWLTGTVRLFKLYVDMNEDVLVLNADKCYQVALRRPFKLTELCFSTANQFKNQSNDILRNFHFNSPMSKLFTKDKSLNSNLLKRFIGSILLKVLNYKNYI